MPSTDQKLKLLHLTNILLTETDDTHGLTAPQIIAKLAQRGVDVERKTFYKDIAALQSFGIDVQKYQRSPVEYGIGDRDFTQEELLLLADSVQSSKFLTKRKADALVKKIEKLGSVHMAEDLRKRVHVEGRIHSQNESVFYNIDAISRAMKAKRKVEFRYFKLDESKHSVAQHEGRLYQETPVQFMYMDGSYYLIAWNDKYKSFTNYRVDRMKNIEVSDQESTRNHQIAEFDVAKFQQRIFGMFNGNPTSVTLLVKADAMSTVIDRFGKDVSSTPAGPGLAHVTATVMEAPTFYGWLTTLGNSVVIEKPESLKNSYLTFLENIAKNYEAGNQLQG